LSIHFIGTIHNYNPPICDGWCLAEQRLQRTHFINADHGTQFALVILGSYQPTKVGVASRGNKRRGCTGRGTVKVFSTGLSRKQPNRCLTGKKRLAQPLWTGE
jgi:hypothetical protein